MNGAEIRIDRGRVRRGSFTSPPSTAQSSSPAKAKAIEAHRLSRVRLLRSGTSDSSGMGVAAGRVKKA
jgi:hypothetical protein